MAKTPPPPTPPRQLVRVAPLALREMVLATLEAYVVPRGGKKKKKKHDGIEIYGQIWGRYRIEGDVIIYTVESFSMSSTSVGKNGDVDPNTRALKLKKGLMEQWKPGLMLLGDFHSHPYENLAEVRRPEKKKPDDRGYEFSDDDVETFLDDKMIWESADRRPLMLVMTVCRIDPIEDGEETALPANVRSFTFGQYRFWLNGSAGYEVPGKGRKPDRLATLDKSSTLTMDLEENFADG